MEPENCPERVELSKRVSDAKAAVKKAERQYDDKALKNARRIGRDAVRALKDHTDEHGCTLPQGVPGSPDRNYAQVNSRQTQHGA